MARKEGPKKKSAKKKSAKKTTAKKKTAKKKVRKVIDEPLKTVFYKQGDLIEGFEILEEASNRTKKKDPMAFDIQWEIDDSFITLHIIGGVSLEKKKK